MLGTIVTKLLDGLYRRVGRPLVIVETGTLRDKDPEPGLVSEERSTLAIALWMDTTGVDHTLHSIDLSPLNIAISRGALWSKGVGHLVEWHEGESAKVLSNLNLQGVDFALLDSDTDPKVILAEYKELNRAMNEPGIVVIDDVFKQNIGVNKGALALPEAERNMRQWFGISNQVAAIAYGVEAEAIVRECA